MAARGSAIAWCVACSLATGFVASPALARPLAPAAAPEDLEAPRPLNEVILTYPDELLRLPSPPGGQVVIGYVVGIDGVPKELEVVQGVHPVLDRVALEAVAQLRYAPAVYRGSAVEVVLSIGLEIAAPTPAAGDGGQIAGDEMNTPTTTATTDTPGEEPAEGPVRVFGRIREAGYRTPIEGASVLAIPAGDLRVGRVKKRIYEETREPVWTARAVTDEDGNFELRGLPEGRARIIVLAPGYQRYEYVVELEAGAKLEVKYFPERLSTNPYRTTVDVEREEMEEITRHSISVEEMSKIPGTQGDALKSIQNFPGVARAPFGAGALAIRGSAPGDSAIYLGYHEIPILYHFGGLTSVFNSDILKQIEFVPGNFDSRYGDATGGIVNVVPRKGRRDGYHGYIDSDVFDTGILFEGRVGDGSFILSGRRSYIDLILPAVIPDDAGLNFTIAPRYWDYQALFDYPISKGEFSARVFGSDDRTKLVFAEQNDDIQDQRDSFETTQYFHRADLVYRNVTGPWEFLVTPSYKRDFFQVRAIDIFNFDFVLDTVSVRAELSRRLSRRARLRVGTEFINYWGSVDVEAPLFVEGDFNNLAVEQLSFYYAVPALYSTLTLGVSDRFTLYPGVRFSFYTAPTERTTTDPRVRFTWELGDSTTLKGGVGLYSQGPQGIDSSDVFGNPRVGPERALHTSLGIAQQIPWEVEIEVTGFYKELWDLLTPSLDLVERADGSVGAENLANHGLGRVFGGELLVRKPLSSNLFGWVSYTIMRSTRRATPSAPERLFDFDQTHLLTLIASYKLPRRWQIGARFRVASGNPYTPVSDGAFASDTGSYIPLSAPQNSGRLPTFHQLDLRVDKAWVYRRAMFTLYLDIQNVYNAQNVEFLSYGYDYRQYITINSLPIIPSLGLKFEF